MIDLDKIKADALAATPGPWSTNSSFLCVWPESSNFAIASVYGNSGTYENHAANATHIANMSPETTLKMVAAVEAAKAYFSEYRGYETKAVVDALAALEQP